jgi:hypothetical protein
MNYWVCSETFVGSTGILPASAGMLPAVCFTHSHATVRNSFPELIQTIRQNAGQGGQHARAPLRDPTIQQFTM